MTTKKTLLKKYAKEREYLLKFLTEKECSEWFQLVAANSFLLGNLPKDQLEWKSEDKDWLYVYSMEYLDFADKENAFIRENVNVRNRKFFLTISTIWADEKHEARKLRESNV